MSEPECTCGDGYDPNCPSDHRAAFPESEGGLEHPTPVPTPREAPVNDAIVIEVHTDAYAIMDSLLQAGLNCDPSLFSIVDKWGEGPEITIEVLLAIVEDRLRHGPNTFPRRQAMQYVQHALRLLLNEYRDPINDAKATGHTGGEQPQP